MSYAISPIDALLCDLLGRASDEVVAAHLAQLTDADWTQLLESSQFHSVTPQIYRRAKDLNSIPLERMEPFKRVYFLNARANAIYFHEFTRLFTALHQADLPVIVLKGAYLAEHVYRNIAARIIGDVDLVFKFADLEKVLKLVNELGYANFPLPLDVERELSLEFGSPPTRPNSADLDIHWDLESANSGFTIDINSVWERSVPVNIADVQVRTLCPVDMLLHLCLHTSYHHHFEGGLRGLADIREVILHPPQPIDWDTFICRAREWKAVRPVFFALHMCRDLTGVTLPEGLLENLFSDRIPADLVDSAITNIFSAGTPPADAITPDMARMLTAKTFAEKVSHWFRAVFISRGMLARRYLIDPHSPRIWLYYPVRLFKMFRLYGLSTLRAIRKEPNALKETVQIQSGNYLKDWMSDKLDNS